MYNHILIPVVFDHEDGIEKAFRAASLLANENAKFTVMHVVELIPSYVLGQIPKDAVEKRHKEMEQSLEKYASKLEGATPLLVSGHTSHEIINFANDNEVDCIVVSSNTPNLEKFFIGSTANRVVDHAGCTVVVIR